jgi:hypothetical protein
MEEQYADVEINEGENKSGQVVYSPEKDFYRGMSGEFRYKAEGLFKKAREKGISIEDIDISTLKENRIDFPGIGEVELPAFIVRIKGKHLQSGQVMMDGKQIDYYNRYQSYVADRIHNKNLVRDDRGKVLRDGGKPTVKAEPELTLSEWERFEIGRSLVDDKEFGLEKTITGACDRVIRKLMGENDWLYPEEARLLDEEFNHVQGKIQQEREARPKVPGPPVKKATDRQIGYLKAKIKNLGFDPENEAVTKEIFRQAALGETGYSELSTSDASKLIDSIGTLVPKVKEALVAKKIIPYYSQGEFSEAGDEIKQ